MAQIEKSTAIKFKNKKKIDEYHNLQGKKFGLGDTHIIMHGTENQRQQASQTNSQFTVSLVITLCFQLL